MRPGKPTGKARKSSVTMIGLSRFFRKRICRISPILLIMSKCYVNYVMLSCFPTSAEAFKKSRCRVPFSRRNQIWIIHRFSPTCVLCFPLSSSSLAICAICLIVVPVGSPMFTLSPPLRYVHLRERRARLRLPFSLLTQATAAPSDTASANSPARCHDSASLVRNPNNVTTPQNAAADAAGIHRSAPP